MLAACCQVSQGERHCARRAGVTLVAIAVQLIITIQKMFQKPTMLGAIWRKINLCATQLTSRPVLRPNDHRMEPLESMLNRSYQDLRGRRVSKKLSGIAESLYEPLQDNTRIEDVRCAPSHAV